MATTADKVNAWYTPSYFSGQGDPWSSAASRGFGDDMREAINARNMALWAETSGMGKSAWDDFVSTITFGLFGGGSSTPTPPPPALTDEQWSQMQEQYTMPFSIGGFSTGRRLSEPWRPSHVGPGGYFAGTNMESTGRTAQRRDGQPGEPVSYPFGMSDPQTRAEKRQLLNEQGQVALGMGNLGQYGMGQLANRGMGNRINSDNLSYGSLFRRQR